MPEAPTNPVPSLDLTPYNTKEEFFAGAGLNTNGWRRAFSYIRGVNDWRDFDDPMYGTNVNFDSTFAEGEIFGPWIIDDLQIALDHMQWVTAGSVDWSAKGETNYWIGRSSPTFPPASNTAWSVSKDLADGQFSATSSQNTQPFMDSAGRKTTSHSHPFEDYYQATQSSRYSYIVGAGPATNSAIYRLGGETAAYVYPLAPFVSGGTGTFDANGLNLVLTNFTLVNTGTIPSNTTDSIYSGRVGVEGQKAEWCDEPDFDSATARGWRTVSGADDKKMLIRANWPYTRE